MSRRYTFDVSVYATVHIEADTEEQARAYLTGFVGSDVKEVLQCVHPVMGEQSLLCDVSYTCDTSEPELVEVDGEAV